VDAVPDQKYLTFNNASYKILFHAWFACPERCGSKLDGLFAGGIDVEQCFGSERQDYGQSP
jgi:hypothetical protein